MSGYQLTEVTVGFLSLLRLGCSFRATISTTDYLNSYEGLSNLIRNRTHGEDGIYFTYTEDNPISFNPFYTDDGVFDVEKKDSIKTLLLTLWKSEDDRVTKTESGELGSALSMFLDKMAKDRDIVPCFNSFYEFMRDEYRAEMANRPIPIYKQDFDIDNFLTTLRQYYHGGRFDFLLNSKPTSTCSTSGLLSSRLIRSKIIENYFRW